MARFARVIVPETPHHVTQRGNAQRFVLSSEEDRGVYVELMWKYARVYRLSVHGYCAMTNHVHLVVAPARLGSLPLFMREVHGRYAAYFNAARGSNGHVWQGRYYSCPLDEGHYWEALRYVELNPVRAGMVGSAEKYEWSSAAAHCGADRAEGLEWREFRGSWTASEWRSYLAEGVGDGEAEAIRRSTHTGRPLGSAEFVRRLEVSLGRRLARRKGGRPRRTAEGAPVALAVAE